MWLILSRQGLHERKIFIAPPLNTGKDRTTLALCVKDPVAGFLDAQQLWTMPESRVHRLPCPPICLHADTVPDTRAMIRKYLEYVETPRGWLCQGRVVWLRLAPTRWVVVNGHRVPTPKTDIELWRSLVKQLSGNLPSLPDDWMLPAVVITNDRYLPKYKGAASPPGVFPLVTVVPVVHDKSLWGKGAPVFQGPAGRDGSPVLYAPLTQCLLTLDHRAIDAEGRERVCADLPRFENWHIPKEIRHTIANEVLSFMNIQPESMS